MPAHLTYGCHGQQSKGKMCVMSARGGGPLSGDVCPGDSGSPLVLWDGQAWTLVGLLSNGASSCFKGLPAVFTRVGDYMDWIEHTVSAYSGVDWGGGNPVDNAVAASNVIYDGISVENKYYPLVPGGRYRRRG